MLNKALLISTILLTVLSFAISFDRAIISKNFEIIDSTIEEEVTTEEITDYFE